MDTNFATAMSRALEETRAGRASEATRIIQAAMGQGTAGTASSAPPAAAPGLPGLDVLKGLNGIGGGNGLNGLRDRKPLGRVIETLTNGKRLRPEGLMQRGRASKIDLPEGARYDRRTHSTAQGSRDYTLFIPSPRDTDPRGLVMMLHGCTQNADDFAAGTQMHIHAERENLILAYPDQDRGANQMGCWNWFQPRDQMRDGGEPAILADLARTLSDEFAIPAGHAFVAGLSAGGAMAAILGVTHGDVFAAVGVHSGLAPGAARDVMSAYSAMSGKGAPFPAAAPVRTIVIHGTADATVHPDNAGQVLASALGGAPSVIVDGGKGDGPAIHLDSDGGVLAESWSVPGLAHAWSGGSPAGSYTAPGSVDASAEMMRFFVNALDDLA